MNGQLEHSNKYVHKCSEDTENEAVTSVMVMVRTHILGASAVEVMPELEFHSTIQVTNNW